MRRVVIGLLCWALSAPLVFPQYTPAGAVFPVSGGGGGHTFTFVQNCQAAAIANTVACTVTAGNLIVVHTHGYGSASPTVSVSDGTSTLTNDVNCSAIDPTGTSRFDCISYLLAANGGAKTYTATLGGSGVNAWNMTLDEYHYTGAGAVTRDTSACSPPAGSGAVSPFILPSITTAASGELLDAGIMVNNSAVITAGGTWTQAAATLSGTAQAYILSSASGATTVNWAGSTSPDDYISCVIAFK